MTLEQVFDFLNFWINKKNNAWYTVSELTELVDRGQLAFYSDLKPLYSKDLLVQEKLSPFIRTYDFNTSNTVSGYIVIPSNSDYLDLLDVQITYALSNRTMYYGVPIVARDERANRLNSQIDPVTVTSPIGEMMIPRYIRLYPTSGYTGTVTYLRRPVKPVFAYTVVSDRVVVYDAVNSTQLEWRETEIVPVLLKSLNSIGINLTDSEIANFAQIKSQENWVGQNRL